jgi:hypothetical protein
MLWEKKLFFKGQEITYLEKISQTADGGYVLVGAFGMIVKLSSKGEIEWAKSLQLTISKEDFIHFDNVSALHDGGFFLSGIYVHPEDNSGWNWRSAPIFVRINSSGKIVSASRFKHPEISGLNDYYQKMVATPDGGSFFARTGNSNHENVTVIRSDNKGKIVWTNRYEIRNFSFQTIASTSDNGAILAGVRADSGKQALLLKLNSNGQIDWKEAVTFDNRIGISHLTPDIAGGYLITGTMATDRHFTTGGPFLLKTNPAGKIVLSTMFNGSGISYGTSIFSTPGNGLLLFGSYNDWIPGSKAETMLLLKMNSEGTVPGCRLFASIKSTSRPLGDVAITNLKIAPSKLSLSATAFQGSITSQPSSSEVATECE